VNYRDYFREKDRPKNIAVVGIGLHGEMVADIKFLIRLGAFVTLHDVRSEKRVGKFIPALKEAGLASANLGKVSSDDLLDADLIILSPEISRKALFLKKAIAKGIPVEFPDVLFLKLAPPITLIGIMGSCGKTTISHLVYGMLKKSFVDYENQGLYLIDPDSTNGTLVHLKKIKTGDVVLARIPEEMIPEYASARVSPHVAVITSLTSAASQETRGAFGILEYQTYNNFIVAPNDVIDAIKKQKDFTPKAKMLRTPGNNAALATQTAELFKVSPEVIQNVVATFSGLRGRQELIKKMEGIEFYNDAASVVPHSTLAALKVLATEKNAILIMGGAYTGYDYGELIRELPSYAKAVILLPGSGSLGVRDSLERLMDIAYFRAQHLEDAVILAKGQAKRGDRIIFSPGCEAIGIDSSRRERAERFVKAVRLL
jgi:UDP-N-acetylmuramoylalanine--D-glutamate ligase